MILLGLQSFFYEDVSTTGALHGVPKSEKRKLAAASLEYNARNPTYRKLFPDLVERAALQRAAAAAAAAASVAGNSNPNINTTAENKDKENGGRGSGRGNDVEGEEEQEDEEHAMLYKVAGMVGMGPRELLVGAVVVVAAVGMALAALTSIDS